MEVELTVHEIADLFPISDQTIEQVKRDIEVNGLIEPIVKYQNQILDGRHRHKACRELEIAPKFVEYTGDDPVGFVLSKNLYRRHLNPSQLAIIAASANRLRPAHARSEARKAKTHAQLAEEVGGSERQIDKASALLNAEDRRQAVPELIRAVQCGYRRLSWAARVAKLAIPEQRRLLSTPLDTPAPRRPRPPRLNEMDQINLDLERWFDRLLKVVSDEKKRGRPSARRRKLLETCDRAQVRLDDARQRISKPIETGLPVEDA